MTYAHEFVSWQDQVTEPPEHPFCSVALYELRTALERRWGEGQTLGCLNRVLIPDTNVRSSHWYGAAIDWRPLTDRLTIVNEIIPYCVAWSEEWGLQRLHDYIGCRIWTAGRTPLDAEACSAWWKAQRPGHGMGESWATYLHLEVRPNRWVDGRTEIERGIL